MVAIDKQVRRQDAGFRFQKLRHRFAVAMRDPVIAIGFLLAAVF
ncbi:hypothetical protein J2T09_001243 [Neorhizobium huautlense]|uniref:Uncharacterized protein n=1 Tax=Neorhizobium huautlense TaxID=67774 RepID=A0ABT9PS11_9HYPH|nr:hypothetical protein [Neorhizobium huautlense]MDP9836499.1 hypothetical protein [Neorhizobium huautlense]